MAAPILEASTDIKATPEKVWSIVSDLQGLNKFSPQVAKTIVRGGPVSLGSKTININKRGLLVWPTSSKVVRFELNKEIAFRIAENGSIWSYTITPSADGVTLTERREAPSGLSKVSEVLQDKIFGGVNNFESELEGGMRETLAKIKAAAEN